MARRITFSLRDTDADIEDYLKSKINYSDYLRELIRNDRKRNARKHRLHKGKKVYIYSGKVHKG